jgi:diguanylate cyclase (GGDEF)-like protein
MSVPRLQTGAAWLAFVLGVVLVPFVTDEAAELPGAWASTAAVCALSLGAGLAVFLRGERASAWLCPTGADRTRMIEAGARVKGARQIASAALATTLIVSVPWFGWPPVLFAAVSIGQMVTLDQRIARSLRPERYVAASLAFTAGTIAAGIPWTGGPDSPLLAWLALPAALLASRFRRRIVVAGFAWLLLLLAVTTLAVDPEGFQRDPTGVLVAVALLIGVTACTLALSENEMQFRQQSRLDPLTGLLNRSALASAMVQVEARAADPRSEVSVVLYDVDLFKQVNDVHGHDVGDDVLLATAQILAAHGRPGDAVYRLGGEEFAVVLVDTGQASALQLAERHRIAVERAHPAGLAVTISAGVASGSSTDATWDKLYPRADAALREAKRAGRNRVLAAPDPSVGTRPSAPVAAAP